MWEVTAETESDVDPSLVWALWENPARWGDWNDQIAEATLDDGFAEGATARIRFRRSPMRMRFVITELHQGELFVDETTLPGARMGHEHRLARDGSTTRIRHRLYIDGPLEKIYAALMGRGMRSAIRTFGPREIALSRSGG